METFRHYIELASIFVLPVMIVFFPVYGLIKRVAVYDEFVIGAKEGFTTAVRIIPYLVAILFAVNMFKASGAMDALTDVLRPALRVLNIPPEVLPMAIVRPLTGSGSFALLSDLTKQYGTTSRISTIAATIYGSAETTFYVLAVYFGAVNIRKTRHALPAGLIADGAAVILAVWAIRIFLGQ
jgi:spore maturation protein B